MYYIKNSAGTRFSLPSTMRPSALGITARTPNLVRARGYDEVHDLSDGLPDPVAFTLSGVIDTERLGLAHNEDALSSYLTDLQYRLSGAVRYGRDSYATPGVSRWEVDVRGGSLVAVPLSDDATDATATIILIPVRVPNVSGLGAYW